MHSFQIGNDRWAEWVFNSGPARDVCGRSRPTQRTAARFNDVLTWLEGKESDAAYILDYFRGLGVIRRWKAQPFEWLPPGAEKPRVPDFLAELAEPLALLIVQAKARKFITEKVASDFEQEAAYAKQFGIAHAVWTDGAPITKPVRENFLRLRGARNHLHDPKTLERFVERIHRAQRIALGELISEGFHASLLCIAAQRAFAHFNFKETISEHTIVSSTPLVDGRSFVLGGGYQNQSWWYALQHRRSG